MLRDGLTAVVRVVALLAVVGSLTFALVSLAPGDPFGELQTESIGADSLRHLRAARGLDAPPTVRLARWARRAVQGDLGRSYVSGLPVSTLLVARLGNTVLLAGTALLIAWTFAVPLGIRTAWHPRGPTAWIVALGSTVLAVVPEVVLAIVAMITAVAWGLPAGGMADRLGAAGTTDLLRQLALPAFVLAAIHIPTVLRHTEAAMRGAFALPLTMGLRARGISSRRVALVHAPRLAAPPLIALFGVSVGTLLSASVVVENVFSWPGLGPLLVEAVLARDAPVIVGATLVSAGLLATGAIASDVLLRVADPRTRPA